MAAGTCINDRKSRVAQGYPFFLKNSPIVRPTMVHRFDHSGHTFNRRRPNDSAYSTHLSSELRMSLNIVDVHAHSAPTAPRVTARVPEVGCSTTNQPLPNKWI